MSNIDQKPISIDEATKPAADEPAADVKAWQDAKVRAAIKGADAGEFASPEDVKEIVLKYVRNG